MDEKILTDIAARVAAMDERQKVALGEDALRALIIKQFEALAQDETFARKMRFGQAADHRISGTKFSRFGLTLADVEWLHDVMQATRKGPSQELAQLFADISEGVYLPMDEVRRIDRAAIDDLFPRVNRHNLPDYMRAIRAMDTAESGYGNQLIGAQYVSDLWEAARQESRVFNLLDTFEMTAPTTYLPVEVDFPELTLVSESTANNSSNYTTVKTGSNRVSASAKKFVIHQMWSGELEEDSIIPFVPFLRRQQALSLAYYSDSLVLNGDDTNAGTGNINLDDADPGDTKHYLAFDGIRHAAIVDCSTNASDAGGAVTLAGLKGLQALMIDTTYMHDWGHPNNPADLVYVCDPFTADKIALLSDFLTVDKFGAQASILTGQVGRIGQHALVTSMAVSKTEADGKVSNTPGNNTKGQVVAFNRRGLKVGWRRRVKVETERIPATDQTRIVTSLRLGLGRFTPTGAASGIEWAAVLYDITV